MQDDAVGGARPPRWSDYEDEGELDAPGADGRSTAPPAGPKVCSASHDAGPAHQAADEVQDEAAIQHHQATIAPQPDTTAAGDTAARVPSGAELPEPTGAAARVAGSTAPDSGNMHCCIDAPATGTLAATWTQSLEDAARLARMHGVTFVLHSAGGSISVVPHPGARLASHTPPPAVDVELPNSGRQPEQPRPEHSQQVQTSSTQQPAAATS
jgi:hypothetical protein